MQYARLDDSQAEIKIAGRKINNLRHANDITLVTKSEKELKSLLMKMKEEVKKLFKSQHSKKKDDGTSWQIEGEKVEAVTCFIFLDSKITVDGDCSHEVQRHLLLGRKAQTNLRQHIKKQRYQFANTGPYSQSYGFPSSHV